MEDRHQDIGKVLHQHAARLMLTSQAYEKEFAWLVFACQHTFSITLFVLGVAASRSPWQNIQLDLVAHKHDT